MERFIFELSSVQLWSPAAAPAATVPQNPPQKTNRLQRNSIQPRAQNSIKLLNVDGFKWRDISPALSPVANWILSKHVHLEAASLVYSTFNVLSSPYFVGPLLFVPFRIGDNVCTLLLLRGFHPHFTLPPEQSTGCWGVIPSEMGQFWTVRLKNQLFGPKQVSYTPLGASGPFLTLEGHFSVKIGNFWFLGLSGTQNFK